MFRTFKTANFSFIGIFVLMAWLQSVCFAQERLVLLPPEYEMPFIAKTLDEAQRWQTVARQKAINYVDALYPRKSNEELPIDMIIESSEKIAPTGDTGKDGYTKHRITYTGNEGERKTAILTIPTGLDNGPFPAILALHGHGGNEEIIFNHRYIYKGFADDFARGGYVVLAPSLEVSSHDDWYCASQLWNLIRLVDILCDHPNVNREKIGAAGLSMGGEWTMWISACDLRIKAAVISGWMCTTKGCLCVPNCPCWELPGFFSMMDVCEFNLLIAPRPVVFENSLHDGCFGIDYCREGFRRIREGYRLFNATAHVSQDSWNAGHEWHGELAFPMIDKVLGGTANEAYRAKQ